MIKFKQLVRLTSNFVKTHKSEIATAAGIGLEGATVYLTVKATIKAKAKADETKKRLDALWAEVEALEAGPEREERQKEMEQTEKKEIRKCGGYIAKSYIWAGLTFVGSVGCFLFSVKNSRKEIRNLSAALAAETALSNWRKKKAKDILTEDQYNELYYGIKKSGKTRETADGEEIEIYENCIPTDNNFDAVIGPQKIAVSKHAMFLSRENCLNDNGIGWWSCNPDYNRHHIKQTFEWANDNILEYGYVMNNEIFKQLNLPAKDECTDLGVVYKPERGKYQIQYELFEVDDPVTGEINFIVDFNYESIRDKINKAIIELGTPDYKKIYE